MTTAETTPAKLNALAADAELYGEGCREYAQGLRAAAIELEAALAREARLRDVCGQLERPLRQAYVQAVGGFRVEDVSQWVEDANLAIEAYEELP